MTSFFDCSDDDGLAEGTKQARASIESGELIVLPTDTVYGIGADAFSAAAVTALLNAKGRDRQSPPPVLIPALATLDALAETVPQEARDLAGAFWPGGLTIVLPAQPSLSWDLGETKGTVALRMPNNPIALALLRSTGPLAVSSANKTGMPAATTARGAEEMLGESVQVYLDGGTVGVDYADADVTETSSTIVDATALASGSGKLRILRHGVISDEQIREVVGDALDDEPAGDQQPT
ncbi:L-threonylcarbamoyladenylate synthase [Humibacter ginsenosidimutans]|uniref:L-threonylcarbamoyladenylate synthase n=1 Tax=Humibacter ginsenosidimutans TaxID=2599293 RepID=A0A5B8M7Y7_9MICO|nr:L-threonylcarbamoyladenylate synthase [Humibacter ginsenosidimutans]QDZ16543.1 threonylcarbamoyl-AMP synthase [Humibacter ginsenosidimutans]